MDERDSQIIRRRRPSFVADIDFPAQFQTTYIPDEYLNQFDGPQAAGMDGVAPPLTREEYLRRLELIQSFPTEPRAMRHYMYHRDPLDTPNRPAGYKSATENAEDRRQEDLIMRLQQYMPK